MLIYWTSRRSYIHLLQDVLIPTIVEYIKTLQKKRNFIVSLDVQVDNSLSNLRTIASAFRYSPMSERTAMFLSVVFTFYAESLLRELSTGTTDT